MEILFGALGLDGRPIERSTLERMAREARALIGGTEELHCEGCVGLGVVRRAEGARIGLLAELARDEARGLASVSLLRLRGAGEFGGGSSDADRLLAAWGRSGDGVCARLRGDFSFALWDDQTRTLTCARDPLGLGPLFHLRIGGTYYFASHLNCLRKLPVYSPVLDEHTLAMRLGLLPPDNERTLWRGIRRLRAGYAVRVGPGGGSETRFWHPPEEGSLMQLGDEECASLCRELFTESVEESLRPGRATGVLLSGGLDSSALACLAARGAEGCLIAASSLLPADHPGAETDERPFIEHLLRRLPRMELHPVCAAGAHPFERLDEHFELHGEPPNAFHFMESALRGAIAGAGAGVALSGLFGDALCSGQGRDSVARLLAGGRFRAALGTSRSLAAAGVLGPRDLLLRQLPLGLLPGLYGVLRSRHALYLAGRRGWDWTAASAPLIARISPEFGAPLSPATLIMRGAAFGSPTIERETLDYSRAGVEIRFPCWDLRLAELCIAMPPEQFVLGGMRRSLFRRAMAGILPDEIRLRPGKHPFIPDFHTQLAGCRDMIEREIRALAEDPNGNDFARGYLDPEKILAGLERIRPSLGTGDWDARSGEVVAKGFNLLRFLRWFSRL